MEPDRPRAPAILRPRRFSEPERTATPEAVFLDRRRFLRALGVLGVGTIAGGAGSLSGCRRGGCAATGARAGVAPERYPAARRAEFDLEVPPVDRPLTDETVAARYNNFYEMSPSKRLGRIAARGLTISPWTLTVDGLVERPWTVDVDELVRTFPLEERVYRFRCVEAWAMVVPWTGLPLRDLLDRVRPLSAARYVRFQSFDRLMESPGRLLQPTLPWPYVEGLTLEEAVNELTFVTTGIYGHPLPRQHGAPVRIIVPWKYGFKGPKSVVRITLTATQPATFWNTITPHEYDFWANVDPGKPHPRWSQVSERLIDTGERRPTQVYNGYGDWVANLYPRT